jgi:hypothetical protein
MITFLELRTDIAKLTKLLVQDEATNIQRMLPHFRMVLQPYFLRDVPELLEKSYAAFEEKATGMLLKSQDWKYGLAIDDMIARAHDLDPSLPWNKAGRDSVALEVSKFLGWMTRDRRIKLGKEVIEHCELAQNGKPYYGYHLHPSRGTVFVFLASQESRPKRVAYLQFLVGYAQIKHGVTEGLGVATEPIGNGRSYDFIVVHSYPPAETIEALKTVDDPFSSKLRPL